MKPFIPGFTLFLLFFLFYGTELSAQNQTREDSLWKEYRVTKDSTKAVLLLVKISENCYNRDRALSEKIANKAVYSAKKLGNKPVLAKALIRLTNVNFDNGKYEEAYYLADGLLKLSEEVNDNLVYAEACKIIGRRYHFRGEYPKALEFYLKGLSKLERGENDQLASDVYNSIGGVYLNQGDTKNAYKYYHKGQEFHFKTKGYNGIARGYLNIGNVLNVEKEYKKAKIVLDSSLYYYKLINSEEGAAYAYSTLSDIYIEKGQTDSALFMLKISYDILKKLNKYYTLSQVNLGISDLYFKKNDYKTALEYVEEGIDVANKTKQSHNIVPLLLLKSQIYEKQGKTKEAFENYKLYKKFSDSTLNASSIKKQAESALKYDYDKIELQREIDRKEKETKHRFVLNATIGGLLLLSVILFLVVRSYRHNQKNSKIIASQKEEVEKQHHLLTEKNKEVLDSIMYAQRLQQAILPSEETIRKYLPESFVLYKPKDIVAGDFYWMETINNLVLLAAADCTGHGVPGSLVSVVCGNALNRAVFEFGLTDPGKILDKTRELVIATFEKSDKEVKDGMDISLCAFDPNSNKLLWAGANNPLWIFNNKDEFEEIKGDKQPIGKFAFEKPFTTHSILVKKGDRLFMFTDGYADQFGGDKGKKLKYKQLQQIIKNSNNLSIKEQEKEIYKKFEAWKGELEQVDDVCIIGVQF